MGARSVAPCGFEEPQRLSLNYNRQVNDLSPLAELKNLEAIDLGNTLVSDLSPLVELKNLKYADLRFTQVSDFSAVAELKNLEFLFSVTRR